MSKRTTEQVFHGIALLVVLWVLWALWKKKGFTLAGLFAKPLGNTANPVVGGGGAAGTPTFTPASYSTGNAALDNAIGQVQDSMSRNPATSESNAPADPSNSFLSGGPGNPMLDTDANLLNFQPDAAGSLFLLPGTYDNGVVSAV